MSDLLRLLQADAITASGVLLAGFAFFCLALWKEWLVTGKRWAEKVAACALLTEALEAANAELRAERDKMIALRVRLERMRVEQEYQRAARGRSAAP